MAQGQYFKRHSWGCLMERYWSDRQLDRITPPQVMDERGRAILRALDHIVGDKPLSEFYVRDADTCPSSALPALIAEYSMEEFIEPGLPEYVQRRILKNAWLLQSLEGYDAGVTLGLSLLGMTAVIEHWWQADPKRAPNTHDLTFFIGEQLFPNDQVFFGAREKKAAIRMIEATKRWSQESTIYVGAALRPRPLRTAKRLSGISICRARMRVIQQTPRLPLALSASQSTRSISVKRLRLGVGGATYVN
jgi:phage tail P2-like protein